MVLQHLRLSCVMSVKSHNVLLHLTAFHDANMWLMEKCMLFTVINCLCLPKHCVWTLPWTCCLTYDSILLTKLYKCLRVHTQLWAFTMILTLSENKVPQFQWILIVSLLNFKHRYREYTLFPKPDHPPCPNIKPLNSATVAISSWPHQTGGANRAHWVWSSLWLHLCRTNSPKTNTLCRCKHMYMILFIDSHIRMYNYI